MRYTTSSGDYDFSIGFSNNCTEDKLKNLIIKQISAHKDSEINVKDSKGVAYVIDSDLPVNDTENRYQVELLKNGVLTEQQNAMPSTLKRPRLCKQDRAPPSPLKKFKTTTEKTSSLSMSNLKDEDIKIILNQYNLKIIPITLEESARNSTRYESDKAKFLALFEFEGVDPSKLKIGDKWVFIKEGKELKSMGSLIKKLKKTKLCTPREDDPQGFFKIVNLVEQKGAKLRIPLEDEDQIINLNGKADASIQLERFEFSLRDIMALLEFKSNPRFRTSKSFNQSIAELIGATLVSDHPVLVAQTDGRDFFLYLLCRDAGSKLRMIYKYETSYVDAIPLIYKWLNKIEFIWMRENQSDAKSDELYAKAYESLKGVYGLSNDLKTIKQRFSKLPPEVNAEQLKNNGFCYELEKSAIEEAWINQFEQIETISASCRTGRVFKLKINQKFYAVKVPEAQPEPKTASNQERRTLSALLRELEAEEEAYQRLWYLENIEKIPLKRCWPKLCYAGPLQLKFGDEGIEEYNMAIVTEFINGRDVRWKNKNDVYVEETRLCEEALYQVNSLGIRHRDARPPNFKITRDDKGDKAWILDFAFSTISITREEPESLIVKEESSIKGINQMDDEDYNDVKDEENEEDEEDEEVEEDEEDEEDKENHKTITQNRKKTTK